jgi:iron complex outermembrane receptor protein/vitamin B12 transporter
LIASTQASALGVDPIGPERARTIDAGIEQTLWEGRVRGRAAFFHNKFSDLIEFVGRNTLPRIGIPAEAAAATTFGAYVNSQSFRARGLEVSADAAIGHVRAGASYTFLDAVVTASFSGNALAPAVNPAFPGVQIGAFSPLVGARPFRRPTHSGSFVVSYVQGPAQATLSGFVSGKQDDSTYLSDAFFGNSLLLPNKNLNAAYQKVDLSGSYRLHPRLRWHVGVENIGGKQYEAVIGFPALPRTFRTGFSVAFGGDRPAP